MSSLHHKVPFSEIGRPVNDRIQEFLSELSAVLDGKIGIGRGKTKSADKRDKSSGSISSRSTKTSKSTKNAKGKTRVMAKNGRVNSELILSGKSSGNLSYSDHSSQATNKEKLVLDLCKKERKKIALLYPNKNTQHRYFTKYRNACKGFFDLKKRPLYLQKIVFDVLKLNLDESELRSNERDFQIDCKTNNVALFEMDAFIKHCQGLLMHHDDPYTLVIGIMGLTGRRPIEVLKTGTFQLTDKKNQNYLFFSGQAKTKNSPNAQHSYQIPVLAPASDLIAALKIVRRLLPFDQRENEQISKSVTGQLLRRVKRLQYCIFTNQHVSLNCRSLRSLYVASAYKLFNISLQSSFNAFAARVLGHSHLDKNTANCYTYFSIIPPGYDLIKEK